MNATVEVQTRTIFLKRALKSSQAAPSPRHIILCGMAYTKVAFCLQPKCTYTSPRLCLEWFPWKQLVILWQKYTTFHDLWEGKQIRKPKACSTIYTLIWWCVGILIPRHLLVHVWANHDQDMWEFFKLFTASTAGCIQCNPECLCCQSTASLCFG